jgi:hypothetical protein
LDSQLFDDGKEMQQAGIVHFSPHNFVLNDQVFSIRIYMNYSILLATLLSVTALCACEKTVNTPAAAPSTIVVAGPAGATGATGASGADGSKGSTGNTGNDGANGSNGNDGANGANGNDGRNGARGAAGATGATGNDGNKGDTGKTGGDTVVILPAQK